jgi:hypothetical protein
MPIRLRLFDHHLESYARATGLGVAPAAAAAASASAAPMFTGSSSS